MIVDELIAVLGYDLKGQDDLRRFNQGMDRAEKKARGFAGAIGKIAIAAAGVLAGLQIGRQIGNFVGDITQVNAQFEKYQATLETIEGSADKAKAALDWVTEFGRTTPYEVGQVTEAFVRLRAYGIDPTNGTLKAVGDASSAMGKNLMQGVEALADAATGEFERLKEFGVRASVAGDQVTFSWTENGKTIDRTVKKQGDAITAFMLDNFRRFDGAMEKQSKTWEGMVSNLSDNWISFLQQIGAAGYYDEIKGRLRGILDTVDEWRENGTFDRIAKRISDGLVGAMDTATHLASQAIRIGKGFYFAADGVADLTARVTGLSKGMAAAGLGVGLLASSAFGRGALLAVARRVPGIAALLVLDDIMSGLAGDESVVGSTAEGQAALDNLRTKFEELTRATQGFADSLGSIRERIVDAFDLPEEFFSFEDIQRRWNELKVDFSEPFEIGGIEIGSLEGAFEAVETWATGAKKRFTQLFTDPVKLVFTLVEDAINRVAAAFERIAGILNSLASPIETIQSAVDGIKRFTGADRQATKGERLSDGGSIADGVNTAQSFIGEKVQGVVGASASGVNAAQSFIEDRVRGLVERMSGLTDQQAAIAARFEAAFGDVTANADGGTSGVNAAAMAQGLENLKAQMAAMGAKEVNQSLQSTITNQDERQFPVTVNSTVNQTVQQAAQAPAAAAQATSSAVGKAAVRTRAAVAQSAASY